MAPNKLIIIIFYLIFSGGKVAETVRSGIVDVSYYENSTGLFLAGNVAALSGIQNNSNIILGCVL